MKAFINFVCLFFILYIDMYFATNNSNISMTMSTKHVNKINLVGVTDDDFVFPTFSPTFIRTNIPTISPSIIPTRIPTFSPTKFPTISPSFIPSKLPTFSPSFIPTRMPSFSPTRFPTISPSLIPTKVPSFFPTFRPSITPTILPSRLPTFSPTFRPTFSPTMNPTKLPTFSPSFRPSLAPTISPSRLPTISPTVRPTLSPTMNPTKLPTIAPTKPTISPTISPTYSPSIRPTKTPTFSPTRIPTTKPTSLPTSIPTSTPTSSPTCIPTSIPTSFPTLIPTSQPSMSSNFDAFPIYISIILNNLELNSLSQKSIETFTEFVINTMLHFVYLPNIVTSYTKIKQYSNSQTQRKLGMIPSMKISLFETSINSTTTPQIIVYIKIITSLAELHSLFPSKSLVLDTYLPLIVNSMYQPTNNPGEKFINELNKWLKASPLTDLNVLVGQITMTYEPMASETNPSPSSSTTIWSNKYILIGAIIGGFVIICGLIYLIRYCTLYQQRNIMPESAIKYPIEQTFYFTDNEAFRKPNLETKSPEQEYNDMIVEFVSPLCGHIVFIRNQNKVILDGWAPWLHPSGQERKPIRIDSRIQYPIPESQPIIKGYIVDTKNCYCCNEMVPIVFEGCKHTMNVKCDQLYRPERNVIFTCQEIITDYVCPGKCCAQRNITCSDQTYLSQEEIAAECPNFIEDTCSVCKINTQRVPCPNRIVQCNNTQVKCKLSCGHDATWICGLGVDPRRFHDSKTNINSKCFFCVKQSWDIYLNLQERMTNEIFINILSNMIEKELSNIGLIESFIHVNNSIVDFIEARSIIINNFVNSMKLGHSELTLPNLPASTSEKDLIECLLKNLDFIFLNISSDNTPDPETIQELFNNYNQTNYGNGLSVKLMKLPILVSMAERDQVKFLAGISFRLKCLESSLPFVLKTQSQDDHNQNPAQQKSIELKNKGFDCVNYYDGQHLDCTDRIYWIPGSCLPLALVTLKLIHKCCICQESFPKLGENGVICIDNHFVCNECFPPYLESAQAPDVIHSYIDMDGLLTCPIPDCRKPYDVWKLACHGCKPEYCRSISNLQFTFQLEKKSTIIREEERQNREKELDRLMQLSIQEREIELAKIEIIENFLNPQCPRCHRVFIDFSGCFALTCGNIQCKAAFCAWCLLDCGTDAHAHAKHCPNSLTPGEIYGNTALLNQAWNVFRKRNIENYLQNKSNVIKEGVKQKLQKEFQDLNLIIN